MDTLLRRAVVRVLMEKRSKAPDELDDELDGEWDDDWERGIFESLQSMQNKGLISNLRIIPRSSEMSEEDSEDGKEQSTKGDKPQGSLWGSLARAIPWLALPAGAFALAKPYIERRQRERLYASYQKEPQIPKDMPEWLLDPKFRKNN